jgi:formylglycine-generating enzyme required for sulfatase activity
MITPDEERRRMSLGHAPAWASEWGEDEFGVFASFRVGEVLQRMRFIPPGSFLMGSPSDEKGRFEQEGPQHLVELTQGFWLADTPCTQALWEQVMGTNPSDFKGPSLPVETAALADCEQFFAELNLRMPGLCVDLPTEAQWEYACRASTAQAPYGVGSDKSLNGTIRQLGDVAWYSENSNRSTRPVATKLPNAWGLYDMFGNVFERCADGMRIYRAMNERDPVGPKGGNRVIRGGSWVDDVRIVRAAYRLGWRVEGTRYRDLGFRLTRRQPLFAYQASGEPSSSQAASGDPSKASDEPA